MNVGFTGTSRGLAPAQAAALESFLSGTLEFHHGDCVGADEQAHAIVAGSARIVIHPPSDSKSRAWCSSDEILDPKPYLDRNHDIVDACEILVACPGQNKEVLRSGTWATVRYARRTGKPVTIIYPDGSLG